MDDVDVIDANPTATTAGDALRFFKKSKKKPDKSDTKVDTPPQYEMPEIDKDSDYYNMNHYKRGTAVIFNHLKFDDYTMGRRDGTMKDSKDLESVLKDLKFDVTVYDDLKYGAIYDVISMWTLIIVAGSDHSDSDCLVVAVLSHGDAGKLHARDHQYPPDTLWKPFSGEKCLTLAGKPKLFFIQACRGDDVDEGVSIRSRTEDDASSMSNVYTIPVMADILVMYSTYDGFYSWRSPITGSWFVQCLCSELKKYARDRDLLTILAFVNRKMAIGYRSNVPGNERMHAKKQIGTIVSTLTRLLYFNPPEN